MIDCGRINIMRYHPLNKASNLTMEWISQSNGTQRAGRAGRIVNGICWHLYSKLKLKEMNQFLDPDIKRLQMEASILTIKSLNLPIVRVDDFMQYLIEAPSSTSIKDAVYLLEKIGAMDPISQQLTPLGQELARLPVHPQLGKMILMAVFFQ